MSVEVVKQVAIRAIQDDTFRTELQADPAKTLSGYDLTDQEREVLSHAQFGSMDDLEGLDERLSKWCLINILLA
jgi:hypothetical protein